MGTINQLESKLRPYKLALVEAFGLDPDTTSSSMSVGPQSITFECLGPIRNVDARLLAGARQPVPDIVEVSASEWTEAQRKAVFDYLGQFPSPIGFTKEQATAPFRADPDRDPTWRDVFRAMHNAGYKLKFEERDGDYWKWIVPVGTMGEVASIIRETLGGDPCWSVEIYGYLMYSVRLHNPPPADVLAAAKLVKLIAETEVQA